MATANAVVQARYSSAQWKEKVVLGKYSLHRREAGGGSSGPGGGCNKCFSRSVGKDDSSSA